jgi:hypothetical protein
MILTNSCRSGLPPGPERGNVTVQTLQAIEERELGSATNGVAKEIGRSRIGGKNVPRVSIVAEYEEPDDHAVNAAPRHHESTNYLLLIYSVVKSVRDSRSMPSRSLW